MSARPACCRRLSELLNEVTANTDDKSAWTALLSFGTNYLLPPKRGGKRHNMTTVLKKRLEKVSRHDDVNSTSPIQTKRRKLDDDGLLAAAVTSEIEDGNIKAAVRILVSNDKPSADTLETLASLLDKHPHPEWLTTIYLRTTSSTKPYKSTKTTSSELFDPFQ